LGTQTPAVDVELQRIVANEIVVVAIFVDTQSKLRMKQLLHLHHFRCFLAIKHRPLLQHMHVEHTFVQQSLDFFFGFALSIFITAQNYIEAEASTLMGIKEIMNPKQDIIMNDVKTQVLVFFDVGSSLGIDRQAP
jgi:hypothetical protein